MEVAELNTFVFRGRLLDMPDEEWLFRAILKEFRALKRGEVLIVYDVDDLTWPLVGRIARKGGFSQSAAEYTFRISDNRKLTKEQQDYLISEFGNAENFRDIEFYAGVENILRPRELGKRVRVLINSNSFSQEISDLKTEQLLAKVPGLRLEDIHMNVVNYAGAKRKNLQRGITFLAEDSPHNVAMSDTICAVMPRNPSWTTHPDSLRTMKHKRVVVCDSLVGINNFIYNGTKLIVDKCGLRKG